MNTTIITSRQWHREETPMRSAPSSIIRTILILLLCFIGVAPYSAADNDLNSIDGSDISITDKLNTGGYIEIKFPIFEAKNYDEMPKTGDGRSSHITINNSKVMEVNASRQDDGDWAWANARRKDSNYRIFTYCTAGNNKNKWVEINSSNWVEGLHYEKEETGNTSYMWATYHIYPTADKLVNQTSYNLTVHLEIDVRGGGDHNCEKKTSSPFTFNPPANITANWGYSTNSGYQTITFSGTAGDKYKIDSGKEESINETGVITKEFEVSNSQRIVNIEYLKKISGYQYYPLKTSVTIPAYQHPDDFSAIMTSTGNVELSWSIDKIEGETVTGDNFEIQRSKDENFATYVDIGKPIAFTGAGKYIVEDMTSSENLNGRYYYRLRRTQTSQWLWGYTRNTDLWLNMHHRYVKEGTPKAEVVDNRWVKITWECDTGAVWSDNSQVMLTRFNENRGTNSVYEIPADKIIKSKVNGNDIYIYTEEIPTTCEIYSYNIHIKPGNANYLTQSPLPVVSEEPLYTTLQGEVTSSEASKGYYSEFVELKWSTDGDPVDMFVISSRIYGSGEEFQHLDQIEGNSASTHYQYSDRKSVPGVIYEYTISSVASCGDKNNVIDSDPIIGFRTPTGDIYGRITFENGQAVTGVEVRSEATDGSGVTGKSFYFDDGTSLSISNDSLLKNDTQEVTLQAWTTGENGTLVKKDGMYSLSVDDDLAVFEVGNQTIKSISSLTSVLNDQEKFMHLTAAMSADSLYIYLNGKLDNSVKRTAIITGNNNPVVIGGDGYNGYIDEVRLWGCCLDSTAVERDYGRYLIGSERGLRALYTFDYASDDNFFDMSYQGTAYHENHGLVNGAKLDLLTPTLDQLCHKSYTDTDGTYQIRALPYTGNGTTYMIIPRLGIHTFASTKELRLINGDAQNHTVNFTDVSSFPVQGYVRYEGGTVPVEGVSFKIDGVTAMDNKGNVIITDASGEFSINVPVGSHEVKAVKANHTFVNEGRITNSDGSDRNYQDMVTGIELWDNTKVRYIGRLTGGPIEENKPIGHSISKNNLGDGIKVTLNYMNNAYEMVSTERNDTLAHLLPSNQTGKEPNSNRINFNTNTITIYPNLATGEFIADLIPEKYDVKIIAPGYENNVGSLGGQLDLTSSFVTEKEVYEYLDSIVRNEETVYLAYADTAYFNKKQIFSVRVAPEIEILQLDKSGTNTLNYFGTDSIPVATTNGTVNYASFDATTGKYLLGRPVFRQNDTYNFQARVFEGYNYYDESGNIVYGKEMDAVPCENATLDYTATMASSSPVSVIANNQGVALFSVVCGEPDLTTATATLSAKAKIDENGTTFDWVDPTGALTHHIVTGSHLTGNNFVTAGPDRILTILRDPPGSHSYSYLEKGTTFSSSETYIGTQYYNGNHLFTNHTGGDIITFAGVGAGKVTKTEVSQGYTIGVEEEEYVTGSETTKNVVTTTTRFRTSDDPRYVGSPGDVFVGHSTNMIFGDCQLVTVLTKDAYKNLQAQQSDFFTTYEQITPSSGEFILVQHKTIGTSDRFGTLFAYPQLYIEENLIPNLEMVKRSMLRSKTEMSESQFQAEANSTGKAVYVSHLSVDDPNFSKSNTDPDFGDALMEDAFMGPSYRVYIPDKIEFVTDTILYLNQAIDGWVEKLAENEKAKVNAKLMQNYSFHAGSPVEYTEQYNHSETSTQKFELSIGAAWLDDFGVIVDGSGVTFSLESHIGTKQGGDFMQDDQYHQTKGFVFADNSNVTDYYSVDVCHEPNYDEDDVQDEAKKDSFSSFIFKTKGGASSGPYEGEERTQYYQPGKYVLNAATTQVEVPSITVEKDFIENVPSGSPAYFTLYLMNESEINADCYFTLIEIDEANPDGAKFSLDGAPLDNGRSIFVPAGEVVKKTLEVSKGNVMNYDNLKLCLHSQLQYDPTDSWADIADTVTISAHFTPSATPVNIKKPANNFTYNTKLPTKMVNGVSKYYQEVLINEFDINYDNFNHIRLQYKPSSNTDEQWVTLMNYYSDKTLYDAAISRGEVADLIKAEDKGILRYEWTIDEPDQYYDLRAVGVSLINNEMIENSSEIVSGIKDMYNPRLFGSAQPADGILSVSDEIRLNFNEKIADGLLTVNNFSVEGIRNGAQGDHSVSLRLDGENDVLSSEFSRNWSNKDLTIEMWIMPDQPADAVLFSHGTADNSLELGLTANNHMKLKVGDKEVVSNDPVAYEQGNWAHVALVYEKTGKVTAYYNFVKYINAANVDRYTGEGAYQFGASVDGENHFAGKMHNARIWDTVISSGYLQSNSLNIFSGHESNLLAYYPMDEAKGEVTIDKARGANLSIGGSEWSLPEGRAVSFNGVDQYVRVNTGSTAVVDSQMDYTIEFWFRGEPGQKDATLVASGRGDNTEYGGSLNLFSIGFEDGILTFRNNGQVATVEGDYLDDDWHHFAVAISRTAGRGQIFIDGTLKSYFDALNIGGLSSAYVYLGARGWTSSEDVTGIIVDNFFKGEIDDYRMWELYKNESLVNNGNSSMLDGEEMGLMAYYPFEHYITWQGTQELQFTLKDMKKQSDPSVVAPDGQQFGANSVETSATAPVREKGSVSQLLYDFVVNNDALIITLAEPLDRIEKSIVTFTVDGVRDVNGNEILSPISWSAYIDRNQLKWSENSVKIETVALTENSFTLKAINNGGSVQHFSIENAPSWLSIEPVSGTIDPASSIDVTFTIDEGLNIGNYDEVIYLCNDNDVTEALDVEVKVRGDKPDWSVNPANYKFNMSIIGKMRINGVFSADEEDILAVFQNGVCVGVANNTYDKINDMWYTFLSVYSNQQASYIEFRIWDASSGKIYAAQPDQDVMFVVDALYGDKNPVIFDGELLHFQEISLNQGWNWVSFNLASDLLQDVTSALSNGNWNANDVVKNRDYFDSYSETESQWIGTLSQNGGLDNMQLFYIKSHKPQQLIMSGTEIDPSKTPLTVNSGWNYISYLPNENFTTVEALSSYEAQQGDIIKSQSQFAVYSGNGWVGNLTFMSPSRGYMLYRNDNSTTTFCYPKTSGMLSTPSHVRSCKTNETGSTSFVNVDYVENMGVIATSSTELFEGDKILAYVNNELRGVSETTIDNNGNELRFISIAGSDIDNNVIFKLSRENEIVAVATNSVPYKSNSLKGSASEPFVIDFSIPDNISAYPNPFVTETFITIPVAESGCLDWGIYNINGEAVVKRSNIVETGVFNTTWDGKTDEGTICPSGFYLIIAENGGKILSTKVIKK